MSNKKLNAIITIGGAVSGTFKTVIGSTKSELNKLGSEISKLKRNQKQLGDSIKTFGSIGKNVDNLRGRYSSVTAELKKLETQQIRLNAIEKSRISNNEKLANLKGQIGATVATVVSMGAPIIQAAKFETSMLGVAKQMDGARDSAGKLTKEYYDMESQVLKLGREFPTSHEEIAKGIGNAFKQGVAKNDVIEFTKVMLKSADAMELPVEQLAEDFGKIGIMYKRANKDIGSLADTINFLDDNALSTSGDIIGFMRRVGGTASMVKIADKQVAAIGSTLLTLGEREETAATAMNAVFSKLGSANTQSKPFLAMLDKIGLKSYEIGNMMQKDAVGGINMVMDAIAKLPKESVLEKIWVPAKISKDGKKQLKPGHYQERASTTQIDAVATLFGAEHWDTFSKLLEGRKELNKQLNWATSKDSEGSVDKEYKARLGTTITQYGIMKNNISELSKVLGTHFLPIVTNVMGKIGVIATKITDWAKANPELTSTIVKTVAALGIFKIGFLGVRIASILLKSKLLDVASIFVKLSGKGLGLGKVFKFLKSPILGAGTGFSVLKNKIVSATVSIFKFITSGNVLRTVLGKIGSIALTSFNMAKNGVIGALAVFGRFKNAVVGASRSIARFATSGNVIRTVFNVALNVVKQLGLALLRTPWGVVAALAIGAGLAIYKYWDQIKAFFSGFWEGLKQGIEPFTTAVSDLVKSTPLLGAAWDLVSGAISKVWNWFTQLLTPVKASKEQIEGAKNAGVKFGELVGSALNLVLSPLKIIVDSFSWILKFGGKVFEWIGKIGSADVAPKITPTVTTTPQPVQAKPPMQIPMQVPKLQMPKLGSSLGESFFKKQNDQSIILNQFNRSEANSNFRTVNNNQTYSQQEMPVPKSVQKYLPSDQKKPTEKSPQQASVNHITNHYSFPIHVGSNANPQEIIDGVMRKLKQAEGIKQRNSMVDWGYSQ